MNTLCKTLTQILTSFKTPDKNSSDKDRYEHTLKDPLDRSRDDMTLYRYKYSTNTLCKTLTHTDTDTNTLCQPDCNNN